MQSPNLAQSGENSFGTTFDLLIRPNLSDDPRCNDMLRRLVESVVVAFPQSTQRAIEDSIVAAIAAQDGRFSNINLARISTDSSNTAQSGSDGGIYVARRPFASATAGAAAGATGATSLSLTDFPNTNYQISVEPTSDPGSTFRWWVTAKTNASCSIAFYCANAVSLNITVQG